MFNGWAWRTFPWCLISINTGLDIDFRAQSFSNILLYLSVPYWHWTRHRFPCSGLFKQLDIPFRALLTLDSTSISVLRESFSNSLVYLSVPYPHWIRHLFPCSESFFSNSMIYLSVPYWHWTRSVLKESIWTSLNQLSVACAVPYYWHWLLDLCVTYRQS